MPAYAIARVRTQPSAALNQAIYPDVMATFLPPTMAVPGFLGYTFVFDDADPATTFNLTTLTGAEAAPAVADVSQAYVDQLDPRFVTETPLKAEGNVRMYATTDRSPAELSPFLHGTTFTLRNQTNAPGLDLEEAIRIATETLIPLFKSLPGFVLYCWLERPEGRIAINIWDTPEDLAAASDALGGMASGVFRHPDRQRGDRLQRHRWLRDDRWPHLIAGPGRAIIALSSFAGSPMDGPMLAPHLLTGAVTLAPSRGPAGQPRDDSYGPRPRPLLLGVEVPREEGQRLRRLRRPAEPGIVGILREPAVRDLDPGRLQRGDHPPRMLVGDRVFVALLQDQEWRARFVDEGDRREILVGRRVRQRLQRPAEDFRVDLLRRPGARPGR